MLICRNAQGVHGQKRLGTPDLNVGVFDAFVLLAELRHLFPSVLRRFAAGFNSENGLCCESVKHWFLTILLVQALKAKAKLFDLLHEHATEKQREFRHRLASSTEDDIVLKDALGIIQFEEFKRRAR